MSARTPMLQQYFRAKEEHPGVLLAMRVGDFYEFYGEDAETAASALEITLTGRDDGPNRIAMAGVPFHAVEKYLARLVAKGHKVAICDQLEDPKQAKGLIKRGVTRVLTPGTVLEDSMLAGGQNNFLAAICVQDGRAGLAILDPSTGEFLVTEIEGEQLEDRLLQELNRVRPTELLIGPKMEAYGEAARNSLGSAVTDQQTLAPDRAARRLLEQFEVKNLQGFGIEDKPSAQIAASMILGYAEKNHLALDHIDSLSSYSVDGFMRLDVATRRSLELTRNMSDGSTKHTLLGVLDRTCTNMGKRLLRQWIEQPLLEIAPIKKRQEAVERFINHALVRGDIQDELKKVQDVERLVARASTGLAGPRDLSALRASLRALPAMAEPLRKVGVGRIQEIREQIGDHRDLALMLEQALVADPPHTVREGGIIRPDFDLELDKLRDLSKNGKAFIATLEAKEKERTGIQTLKVGFNNVFGYYLEVSKQHQSKVPADYIRKQTTANAERYITAELKEHESAVLGAEEKAAALEADLFHRLRTRVAEHASVLLKTARALAEIDTLCSLAEVAAFSGYVKPTLVEDDVLFMQCARHPVVEATTSRFVPNDVALGNLDIPPLEGRAVSLKRTGVGSVGVVSEDETTSPAEAGEVGERSEPGGGRPPTSSAEAAKLKRAPAVRASDRDVLAEQAHEIPQPNVGRGGSPPDSQPETDSPPIPETRTMILTGPNMAGKSTYLRQTALIVLMAQIGSFVPAKSATLGLCDRIFARIGAKDELALGQSTFMVEMVESANILNHAGPRSLVILDEVGRGTSTFDGLAIAWAMVEHLAACGSKTMFATHYHQLNALAEQLPTVGNFRVSVEEIGDDIVWTHRVLPGGTDRSYGVHVARMAGVPGAVLKRASQILRDLEEKDAAPKVVRTEKLQLTLFEAEESPVVAELKGLDVNTLTPLEALRLLDEWKRKI